MRKKGEAGIFVRNMRTGRTTTVAGSANGVSSYCAGSFLWAGDCVDIAGNGRFVAFWTDASLLPEDPDGTTGRLPDLYVRNLATGALALVNVPTTGAPPATPPYRGTYGFSVGLSTDGRYVAFDSTDQTLDPASIPATPTAENLYIRDRGPQG